MDIKKVSEQSANEENGAVIPIVDKTTDEPYRAEDGSESTITVVGSESKRYRRAQDQLTRRTIKRRGAPSPDELRDDRIELAAAAVTAWHGWESKEGDVATPVQCTPENVKQLLGASQDILQQVETGIREHARFFAKPSRS